MGLLNLPKQVFYGSLILHQRRSIELYLFFSARFIAMGRWEKRGVRKFLAVRFRQAPMEDGLPFARPAAEIFPVSSNRRSLGRHYLS